MYRSCSKWLRAKSIDWNLPHIEPANWGVEQTYYVCREDKGKGKSIMCPGQNGFVLSDDIIVNTNTIIEDLQSALIAEIGAFEVEEKRRRKRVLGVKRCRQKSSFLTQKSKTGSKYTDHKVVVLCASPERIEKIYTFLKSYYKKYRNALILFIRARAKSGKEGFPEGT